VPQGAGITFRSIRKPIQLRMKMKGLFIAVTLIVITIAGTSFNEGKDFKLYDSPLQDTIKNLRDGIFEGRSQASYSDEPYWGIVKLTIKEGVFSDVKFIIRDSALHEFFDAKYEKHFEGNPVYVEQSRNDWKGVQTYPGKLTGSKDLKSVDAMSGATWSYNIFKASVEDALKNPK
jgi:major membrane immunogen (membrane-anchored lipoprotein)